MSTSEVTNTETPPPANGPEPAEDEVGAHDDEHWQLEERRRDAYRIG